MRPFGAFVLVSVLCVLSVCHCSAYVYPLAPSVGTRTAAPWVVGAQQPLETAEAYAARQLTLGVSHASNNGNEDNQLLSTPTYEAFGAAIQSVRWALGSDGANGGVVPVAASNCADRINTVLIDGAGGITATLVGVAKADKFAGMVALAQLTDPDVAGGVRILWTVSGPITDNLRNRLITVNNNMNNVPGGGNFATNAAPQAAAAALGTWEFVDPFALYPGIAPAVTPNAHCLATTTPVDQAAPVMPAVVHGVPPAQTVNGAAFCLRSHPFAEFSYVAQRRRSDNSVSYARLNGAGAQQEAGLPICNCAGSRLAATLKLLGVFHAPGMSRADAAAAVTGADRLPAEADDAFAARQLARTAHLAARAQFVANDRVQCFAESRNNANDPRNPSYEVSGAGNFDTRPTAASCSTCQVHIQLMYGNAVAACGVGTIGAARGVGQTAWNAKGVLAKATVFVEEHAHDHEQHAGEDRMALSHEAPRQHKSAAAKRIAKRIGV